MRLEDLNAHYTTHSKRMANVLQRLSNLHISLYFYGLQVRHTDPDVGNDIIEIAGRGLNATQDAYEAAALLAQDMANMATASAEMVRRVRDD